MHPHWPESESTRVEARFREAKLSGDHLQLAHAAAECARVYAALGDDAKECEYLHALGKYQILTGAYGACLETVELLFKSPRIHVDPVLQARALILRAAALRNQANHGPAIEDARRALTSLDGLKGNFRFRAEACQALIASLVEAGKIGEAWTVRDQLADSLNQTSDKQLAGQGYWTLGNLAFAHGQHTEGLEYHVRAAGFLQLANDIHLWARFNKASADIQLQAGLVNEQIQDCIERAELAYGIVGGSAAELTGLAVTRARWNRSRGRLREASEIMEKAIREAGETQALENASAHILWAQILTDLGRPADAAFQRSKANQIQERVSTARERPAIP